MLAATGLYPARSLARLRLFPRKHIQDYAADGPQVTLLVVACPLACLGCAPRLDAGLSNDHWFFPYVPCDVEVDDLQANIRSLATEIDQEIIGFQITVTDAMLVHVTNSADQLA